MKNPICINASPEFRVLYPYQESKFQLGWIARRKFKRTKFVNGARMHVRGGGARVYLV